MTNMKKIQKTSVLERTEAPPALVLPFSLNLI